MSKEYLQSEEPTLISDFMQLLAQCQPVLKSTDGIVDDYCLPADVMQKMIGRVMLAHGELAEMRLELIERETGP